MNGLDISGIMDIEAIDREEITSRSKGIIEAEKQCRIALSADAPREIKLAWNAGGKYGRDTIIVLMPGHSIVQPLSKAESWFGPFAMPLEYRKVNDVAEKERMRTYYAQEKARYLNRYDYHRAASVSKGGYEPTGPHRSPDVTCTVLESDGTEHEPVRLYELYRIGEFDPLKDTFGVKESADAIEARYKAELEETRTHYEREQAKMRAQLAEVTGLVKGLAVAAGGK